MKNMHDEHDEPMSIMEDEDSNGSNVAGSHFTQDDKHILSVDVDDHHEMSLMSNDEWHINLFGEIIHDIDLANEQPNLTDVDIPAVAEEDKAVLDKNPTAVSLQNIILASYL